jgi:hypothetical protein
MNPEDHTSEEGFLFSLGGNQFTEKDSGMMTQDDWKKAIDRLMALTGGSAAGGRLYTAIREYHGKPNNKALNLALACGGCTSMIYYAVSKLSENHLRKDTTPPAVKCPLCGHTGNHGYAGVSS